MIEDIKEVVKEESEVNNHKIHNCLSCPYAFASDTGVECRRRESEGVIVTLTEDQIFMNCNARDVKVWDERHVDWHLDCLKSKEYKNDLFKRQKEYTKVINDIVGGD